VACPHAAAHSDCVDVAYGRPFIVARAENRGGGPCGSRNVTARPNATADQVLGEIRDYCARRARRIHFGRRVSTMASWCRACATAQNHPRHSRQVRAYLSQYRARHPRTKQAVAGAQRNGPRGPTQARRLPFFDNRQNISCSSRPAARKTESQTGFRSNSANLQPTPPALRISTQVATAPSCRGDAGAARPLPDHAALRRGQEIKL